jgi:hypothetical protein
LRQGYAQSVFSTTYHGNNRPQFTYIFILFQVVVASFYSDVYWPNRTPKIIAPYPNSQSTIRNGSTLSSEHVNPGYVSYTAVDQHESSEVDVKPSLGMLNLASLDRHESSEVDVKPSLGMLNLASL